MKNKKMDEYDTVSSILRVLNLLHKIPGAWDPWSRPPGMATLCSTEFVGLCRSDQECPAGSPCGP